MALRIRIKGQLDRRGGKWMFSKHACIAGESNRIESNQEQRDKDA
jgi:hypothetical protein